MQDQPQDEHEPQDQQRQDDTGGSASGGPSSSGPYTGGGASSSGSYSSGPYAGSPYTGGPYTGSTYGARPPLRRRMEGRVLAGVAGGVADYFDLDPTVVRLGFAGLTVFAGIGLPAYLAAWLLIPAEGAANTVADDLLYHASNLFDEAEVRMAEVRMGGRAR